MIAGPSGGGKSRLLRALADLDPHQGQLRLEGHTPEALGGPAWRRRVALMPAEPVWWAEHAGAHFPRPPAPEALAALGLPADILERPVSRLSTGERQRLWLLRLLANRPRLLLLDEPTANLDPQSRLRVERRLEAERRAGDMAMVWVTHDPAQAERVASRRLWMVGGRLQREAPAVRAEA